MGARNHKKKGYFYALYDKSDYCIGTFTVRELSQFLECSENTVYSKVFNCMHGNKKRMKTPLGWCRLYRYDE